MCGNFLNPNCLPFRTTFAAAAAGVPSTAAITASKWGFNRATNVAFGPSAERFLLLSSLLSSLTTKICFQNIVAKY